MDLRGLPINGRRTADCGNLSGTMGQEDTGSNVEGLWQRAVNGTATPQQVAAAACAYPVPAAAPATDGVEDDDDEEFLDPVTKEVVIDPVVGSDGITYDRLKAYKLAVRGSRMPGAADGFSLGPDSVNFRRRLRQAHPETEAAMKKQREACKQAGQAALAGEDFNTALYWFKLVRTWAPASLQAEIERCEAVGADPAESGMAGSPDEEIGSDALLHRLYHIINSDPEAALDIIDQLLALCTNDGSRAMFLEMRGDANWHVQRREAAIRDYDAVLVVKPDRENALVGRAIAYDSLGEHRAAVPDCDAVIWLTAGYSLVHALTLRGCQKAALNDYEGALADYNAAVVIDPTNKKALQTRGMFQLQLGRLQGAVADLQAAVELDPDDVGGKKALRKAQRRLDRHKDGQSRSKRSSQQAARR